MPAPKVNRLPTAPAKIADPANFLNTSGLFLQALPQYRNELLYLLNYLNSQKPNKFHGGTITGINPVKPVFKDIPDVIGVGSTFVDIVDTVYKHVRELSGTTKELGEYLDSIISALGTVNVDEDIPFAPPISLPPVKNMPITLFNTVAGDFTDTHRILVNALESYVDYCNSLVADDMDFGGLEEEVDELIDAGSLEDTTYENTTTYL